MTDEKHVELEGIVKECIRGNVRVILPSGQEIIATLSGKMKMNKITVLSGDKVFLKVSPYDTSRGFIYKVVKNKGTSYANSPRHD